jgi:hypothetical protein
VENAMALSMYQVSVPVFINALNNLSTLLRKGEAFAQAKKIEPSVLLGMRLAPDMYPLTRQVQLASDNSKGPAARLAGLDRPSFEDTETTFDELQQRIAKTIAFLESIDASKLDGAESRTITLQVRNKDVNFRGDAYLLHFVLPNFFFHIATAHAILRHAGVEIGKLDYLGPFRTE